MPEMNRRSLLKATGTLISRAVWHAVLPAQGNRAKELLFSLAHLTVLGCPPPEATRIAAHAGYDLVSLRIIPMGLPNEPLYDLARNPVLLRETRTALVETGLRLHDIELARIADGVDVRSYLPAIETGAELGARRVIASIWTRDRHAAIDSLDSLCELSAKAGISVSLEFVSWANVSTLQEVLALRRAVGTAAPGLLIDVLHFQRARVRLEELNAVPREWFHFAHISDAPREAPTTQDGLIHEGREARLYPGEGGIDIAGIVNRIPVVPYSLEIPNIQRVRELGYAEHARRCLETTRKYFHAHRRA